MDKREVGYAFVGIVVYIALADTAAANPTPPSRLPQLKLLLYRLNAGQVEGYPPTQGEDNDYQLDELWKNPKIMAGSRLVSSRQAASEGEQFRGGLNDVCEAVVDNSFQPHLGINRNGTTVEIRQLEDEPQTFFVEYCAAEEASCSGVEKDNIVTSKCETRLRWQPAWTRPYRSTDRWVSDHILIPYSCQCYFVASSGADGRVFNWTFED